MKKLNVTKIYTVLMTLLLLIFASVAAEAMTLTVTNTADNGLGSLRNSVLLANTLTSDDTINFNIPLTDAGCANGVCTITLTGGDLVINSAAMSGTLTVTGTGAKVLRVSGNNQSRIFFAGTGTNLTISGLTLMNGSSTGGSTDTNNSFGRLGGAVCNFGTTIISNSIITGSTAVDNGGGIYNENGTVRVTNSTISNNSVTGNAGFAGGGGGGFYTNGGTFDLINSTVSGNSVMQFGGGIFLINGTVNVSNSTISGNTANGDGAGGGISSMNATLNVSNSTISANRAVNTASVNSGGGIWISNSTTGIRSTIIAGNTAVNAASAPDVRLDFGAITSNGYNLVGDTSNIGNPITFQSSDIVNQNARLAALADNGGATQTHALLTNSPAIDKGIAAGTTADQRGIMRPIDNPNISNAADGSDIGAFEAANSTAAGANIGGRILTSTGRGLMNAYVSLMTASGATRTTRTNAGGHFIFANVAAGETIILSIRSKRYQFDAQAFSISGDLNEIIFRPVR